MQSKELQSLVERAYRGNVQIQTTFDAQGRKLAHVTAEWDAAGLEEIEALCAEYEIDFQAIIRDMLALAMKGHQAQLERRRK